MVLDFGTLRRQADRWGGDKNRTYMPIEADSACRCSVVGCGLILYNFLSSSAWSGEGRMRIRRWLLSES